MLDNFGHSLPSPFQCGFQRNNSKATAAITIQNNIARALDKKKEVIVVSTDMSAALNLVDKDVLLPQMAKLGIPKNLIRIYNDFLSDRRNYVQWDQYSWAAHQVCTCINF
jgi:hypothetical protein